MGYEYRSPLTIGGLPLVHVAFGIDAYTGRQRVARGVIAIGQVAFGMVAIAPVAVGLVAIGQLAAGVCAGAGQIATGVYAAGQLVAAAASGLGQLASAHVVHGELIARATWPLVAAWLVVGTLLGGTMWPARRRLAPLVDRDIPFRLSLARPGMVAIEGRVVPLEILEAPLSKRACIGYEVQREWQRPERRCADFLIEDRSGRARVIADGAQLFLESTHHEQAYVENAVMRGGSSTSAVVVSQPRASGQERVLVAGDHVVVTGMAMKAMDGGAAPKIDPKKIQLVIHGGAGGPVMVTNRWLDELRAEESLGLWLAGAMGLASLLLLLVTA